MVRSNAECTQHLRQNRRCLPDLVLLDVQLPGSTGASLCKEIRARFTRNQARMPVRDNACTCSQCSRVVKWCKGQHTGVLRAPCQARAAKFSLHSFCVLPRSCCTQPCPPCTRAVQGLPPAARTGHPHAHGASPATSHPPPRTPQLPIIMLSACSSKEGIVEGLSAGANDYISKPFKCVAAWPCLASLLGAAPCSWLHGVSLLLTTLVSTVSPSSAAGAWPCSWLHGVPLLLTTLVTTSSPSSAAGAWPCSWLHGVPLLLTTLVTTVSPSSAAGAWPCSWLHGVPLLLTTLVTTLSPSSAVEVLAVPGKPAKGAGPRTAAVPMLSRAQGRALRQQFHLAGLKTNTRTHTHTRARACAHTHAP